MNALCLGPIPAPRELPERCCHRPLPPYRFVPGCCPHPYRDPEGHRVGLAPGTPASEAWCYGVDLFNARFFWEAHEAWESVWRAAPRRSSEYYATKGMIQIAASLLTLHMCRTKAARHLAERGASFLRRASESSPTYRQLDLTAVARLARERVVEPTELPQLEAAAFFLRLGQESRTDSLSPDGIRNR